MLDQLLLSKEDFAYIKVTFNVRMKTVYLFLTGFILSSEKMPLLFHTEQSRYLKLSLSATIFVVSTKN